MIIATYRLAALVTLTWLLAGPSLCHLAAEAATESSETLIEDAVVYALPVYEMARTRYRALWDPSNPRRGTLNRFTHLRTLADHSQRAVTAPNNDTLYSSARLDVSIEPLVLSVPDMGARYASFQFLDVFSNTFAMISRRTTGTVKGDFLIAGPGWNGTAPTGMTVIRSPSYAVWLLGRTLVNGADDLPAVHQLQDKMSLAPLSVWSGGGPSTGRSKLKLPVRTRPDHATNFMAVVNQVLAENPVPDQDKPILTRIARVAIGPTLTAPSTALIEAWQAAFPAVLDKLRSESQRADQAHAGWTYPKDNLGNFGTDYRYRALVAIGGLGALELAEAMYMHADVDVDGATLDGAVPHRLRLPPGGLPVNAFWSLTLYERTSSGQYFLVDNPLHRYSIGDRSPGLRRNPDGSIDLYIQKDSPGPDRETNWLPAPAGPFRLSMRAYEPKPDLLSGRFRLPPVERAAR